MSKGYRRNIALVILIIGFVPGLFAQDFIHEVTFDKTDVLIGEPIEVTLNIYTSTYFTKGVSPENIKVNGAFSVFLQTVSSSISRNGKTYAGVRIIYKVFPYRSGTLVFPEIVTTVTSPKEGDYRGVEQQVTTPEKTFRVRPIPPGQNSDTWLVTNRFSVQEIWGRSLSDVKVGDVIDRSFNLEASNTVGELIPPITWDSVGGVSMYPEGTNAETVQDRSVISAVRKETMRYLFEREGLVQLPELVFHWYNPEDGQLYKRTIEAVTIEVQPNPDLGMLTSIRDSLEAASAQDVDGDAEKRTILGLTPLQMLLVVLGNALGIYFLVKGLKYLVQGYQARKAEYLNSEAYYFDQFMKNARGGSPSEVVNAAYRWIDQLELSEPTLRYFSGRYGDSDLQNSTQLIEESVRNRSESLVLNTRAWKKARKLFKNGTKVRHSKDWYHLNE